MVVNDADVKELQVDALGICEDLGAILEEARRRQTKHKRLHEYYFKLCDDIVNVRKGVFAVNPKLTALINGLKEYPEEDE